MPSDDRMSQVLAALAPAAEPWRRAVAATSEELRGVLAGPETPATAAHTLGEFAQGRIDLSRFAGLTSRTQKFEDVDLVRLRVALDTLQALARRTLEDLVVVKVAPGARLRDAVAAALDEVGRAFGAARQVAQVRADGGRELVADAIEPHLPFAQWSRRERELAPPLVVRVAGADLRGCDLTEFLDGALRVALVVEGPCAPAALVRLVTPGTFVAQSRDTSALARLVAHRGPGVAAIVDGDAAVFVHDPAAGRAPWERTKIERMPAQRPRAAIGPWSPAQQEEELRQLVALATRPSAAAMATAAASLSSKDGAGVESDPAGRLAGWLLEAAAPSQANHG